MRNGWKRLIAAACLVSPAWAQLGQQPGASTRPASNPQPPVTNAISAQNYEYQGSVPQGTSTLTPLDLSLRDAIARGLKYNLGVLSSAETTQNVRAQRLRVLSGLLPNITGDYTQNVQQINIAAQGIRFNAPPGSPIVIPSIVGPFGNIDARANASQTVFDLSQYRNLKSANISVTAAQLSAADSRDLVVQAVANAYLLIIADQARIDTAVSQVATSQALFQRASDQRAAGTAPGIDVLRAEVQLETDRQSLLADRNVFSKDKLSLGRVIGLPSGQDFRLTDSLPFSPLNGITPEDALRNAYDHRSDYRAAEAQVHAAEVARRGTVAEYYPTINLTGNYGDSGLNIGNSHGVFLITGAFRFNIFDGGRIRSDIEQADVVLQQRRDALGDLKGRIDQEVRSALLDLQSAADQVVVATRNVDLANQTLTQARDRFSAGVADNIEVVQAQQSVVTANQNLINSTYQHNSAKIELARSLGLTEENLNRFIGSK